jgi:hypothetical protein
MTLDPLVLLIVLVGTVLTGGVSVAAAGGLWQRLLLLGMFSGLCFYSGVGAAFPDVPGYYLVYYFGFLVAFAWGFWFFSVIFVDLGIRSGRALTRFLDNVDFHPAWPLVICIYLLIHLVPLVYPEVRVHYLFAPPRPDLTGVWAMRWELEGMDIFEKLVEYAKVLLTPFFYIALFRYRDRFRRILLIFALLLYFQYVAGGYMSRSEVVIAVSTAWLATWAARPRYRRALAIVAVMAVPLILMVSYYYGVIRIGGTPERVTPVQAVELVLEQEISFPRNVGVHIIESGARVDLSNYLRWMFTLPIPKLLTGEIAGARINYEISELILGLPRGVRGWYVVLPGLVAESLYIFGRHFFWLHALFVAFLAAVVTRLIERTPQLLFLQAYVVVTFAYHLNRGGISGPLATLVNHFMLFYLFVFVHLSGLCGKRQAVARGQRRVSDER